MPISEIRVSSGRIGMGYVAFLACVFLSGIAIPIACKAWIPPCVPGYESKVSMAIATVKHFARQARKAKLSIAGMVVVFDSWSPDDVDYSEQVQSYLPSG